MKAMEKEGGMYTLYTRGGQFEADEVLARCYLLSLLTDHHAPRRKRPAP